MSQKCCCNGNALSTVGIHFISTCLPALSASRHIFYWRQPQIQWRVTVPIYIYEQDWHIPPVQSLRGKTCLWFMGGKTWDMDFVKLYWGVNVLQGWSTRDTMLHTYWSPILFSKVLWTCIQFFFPSVRHHAL